MLVYFRAIKPFRLICVCKMCIQKLLSDFLYLLGSFHIRPALFSIHYGKFVQHSHPGIFVQHSPRDICSALTPGYLFSIHHVKFVQHSPRDICSAFTTEKIFVQHSPRNSCSALTTEYLLSIYPGIFVQHSPRKICSAFINNYGIGMFFNIHPVIFVQHSPRKICHHLAWKTLFLHSWWKKIRNAYARMQSWARSPLKRWSVEVRWSVTQRINAYFSMGKSRP